MVSDSRYFLTARRLGVHARPLLWLAAGGVAFMLLAGCSSPVKSPRFSKSSSQSRVGGLVNSGPTPLDRVLAPSHHRDWIDTQAVLPTAKLEGDRVTVRNIRNCDYVTENDVLVNYYDRDFNLQDLESVDFIVVPFYDASALAHTMLSFGFGQGRYVVSSVEARLEKGESYSPVSGAARQYELMYVLADERDVIRLRTEVRSADVYVYRSTASPAHAQKLFVDVLNRVNHLAENPEFYDTVTNNCTSNIVQHVNHLVPGKVPYDYRVFLPGFSPQLAYDLGLLDQTVPFEELHRRARINDLAHRYRHSPEFSEKIRR